MQYLYCISHSHHWLQIALWCKRTKQRHVYTEWQGNSPLAGMAIALCILQCLLCWPPCQRRTALWFLPWTLHSHRWSLLVLFFQKVLSLFFNLLLILFLCPLCFLPCSVCCHCKYIGLRQASKIWICFWIYFRIRTILSGGIPLVYPLPFLFYSPLFSWPFAISPERHRALLPFYSLSLLLEKKIDAKISHFYRWYILY